MGSAAAASETVPRASAAEVRVKTGSAGRPPSTVPLAASDRSDSLIAFAKSCASRARGSAWPLVPSAPVALRSELITASGRGGAEWIGEAASAQVAARSAAQSLATDRMIMGNSD